MQFTGDPPSVRPGYGAPTLRLNQRHEDGRKGDRWISLSSHCKQPSHADAVVPPLMLAPTGRAQRQKPGELGEGVTGKIVPESLSGPEGDVPRVYPSHLASRRIVASIAPIKNPGRAGSGGPLGAALLLYLTRGPTMDGWGRGGGHEVSPLGSME